MQKNGSVALLLLYSCNDCLYQVSRIYCITSQGKAGTPIGGRSLSSHCLFILILILILILFVLFSVVFSLSLLLLLGSSLVARHGVVYRGGVRWGTVPSIGDLLLSVSSVLGYLRLKDVIFHFFGNDGRSVVLYQRVLPPWDIPVRALPGIPLPLPILSKHHMDTVVHCLESLGVGAAHCLGSGRCLVPRCVLLCDGVKSLCGCPFTSGFSNGARSLVVRPSRPVPRLMASCRGSFCFQWAKGC